jgi:hypothetical protein
MEPSKVEQMADRIVGLEAEIRRLRRLVVIPILMTLVVAGFAAFTRPRAGRPLSVGSVEIRDEQGRLRGAFGVDRVGLPGLRLYDHRGLEQVSLSIPSDDTSALYFADRGNPRVLLESSIQGSALLRFVGPENRDGAMLSLAPDGSTRLSLADGEWEARAGVLGGPSVTATEPAGPSADWLMRAATKPPTPKPALKQTSASLSTESPTITGSTRSAQAAPGGPNLRMPLSYHMLPQD